MVRPIKRKQIPNLQEAIKETAWKQIAEFGAPTLSLRAIARLKVASPTAQAKRTSSKPLYGG